MSKKSDVSKVEDISARRFQKLADENRELRHYVAEVMKRLRQNEQLFSQLFELESQVLTSTDPEDLCFTLLRGLRSGFDLDFVRFWLDRSSFMGGRKLDALSERDLIWVESGEIAQMGLSRKRAWLMRLSPDNNFDWLVTQDEHLGSLALLTLGDLDHPFGVLGVGSVDRDRFSPDQSTDFLQHLAQVVGLTMEHSVARERLARLSITDSLTGSHNRRFLQPHSHQPLSQWFGKDSNVVCLYTDVDNFKGINERLGQEQADQLLTSVCKSMRQFVRANDPLIRMEGEEFVLLLPACSLSQAQEIAGRIVDAVAAIEVGGDETVSLSMGVAFSSARQDMAVKQLIALADQAMYVAKALGGNRYEMAEQEEHNGTDEDVS
jgi:two-component system cell cycle response regulator